MEKMKMQSLDKVAENIRNVEALFPNAVTEQKFGGRYEKLLILMCCGRS